METIRLIAVLLCLAGAMAADYFVFQPGDPINSTTLAQLRETELAKLNTYRNAHGVGTVKTTEFLQNAAQLYAQYLCDTQTFAHSI